MSRNSFVACGLAECPVCLGDFPGVLGSELESKPVERRSLSELVDITIELSEPKPCDCGLCFGVYRGDDTDEVLRARVHGLGRSSELYRFGGWRTEMDMAGNAIRVREPVPPPQLEVGAPSLAWATQSNAEEIVRALERMVMVDQVARDAGIPIKLLTSADYTLPGSGRISAGYDRSDWHPTPPDLVGMAATERDPLTKIMDDKRREDREARRRADEARPIRRDLAEALERQKAVTPKPR